MNDETRSNSDALTVFVLRALCASVTQNRLIRRKDQEESCRFQEEPLCRSAACRVSRGAIYADVEPAAFQEEPLCRSGACHVRSAACCILPRLKEPFMLICGLPRFEGSHLYLPRSGSRSQLRQKTYTHRRIIVGKTCSTSTHVQCHCMIRKST